jgi:RHS repeat-associated protein
LKNRLVKVTDPLGNFTTYAYDKLDRKTKVTNPIGKETTFEYDALGNLAKITDPNGNEIRYEYDANGRRTKMIDAENRETVYEYEAMGRMNKVTDTQGGTTQAEFDDRGNLIKVTDPNGKETSYEYDELGRVVKETDPLLNETTYTFDAAGNLKTKLDANGQTTTYAYDNVSRLIQKSYSGGGSVIYTYDDAGNRLTMTDAAGTTTYAYDNVNSLIQVTDPYGRAVQYAYDAAGRKESITYPGSLQVTYEYDAAGRLRFVRDWLGIQTEFTYDDAGQILSQINGNGTTVSWVYDDAGRLTSLSNRKSDLSVINDQTFTLDNVGNRTQIVENVPLVPSITDRALTFTHNDGHQVISDSLKTYTYDSNGNRSGWSEGAVSTTYTFNAMDRLTQVSDDGNNTNTYVYNGDGDRIASNRNGIETRYVLDPTGSMTDVIVETDASGNVQRYYIHKNGLLYSIETGTNVKHYYHYDAVGNTMALTDQSETVTDKYAYSPYGMNAGEQGSTHNPFRYVGQYGVMEEENGFLFMRARFYDPVTKRFLSKDPVKGYVHAPITLNRYVYTENNPVLHNDPDGEIIITGSIIAGLVIKAAITWAANKYIVKPLVVPAVVKFGQRLPGSYSRRHGIDPNEYNEEAAETVFDVGFAVASTVTSGIHNAHKVASAHKGKILAARKLNAILHSHSSAGRIGGLTTAIRAALKVGAKQWAFDEISQNIIEKMIIEPSFNHGKI